MFRGTMKCRFVRNNDDVADLLLIHEAGAHSPIQLFLFMNAPAALAAPYRDGAEFFVEIRPSLPGSDDDGDGMDAGVPTG